LFNYLETAVFSVLVVSSDTPSARQRSLHTHVGGVEGWPVIAAKLRCWIAAAERRNYFERARWERFGFGCARTLGFQMFFAATEELFEFLLRADLGLGRIALIQTHGPSFQKPPLETTARKPCYGSLDLASRTVKNFCGNCWDFRGR